MSPIRWILDSRGSWKRGNIRYGSKTWDIFCLSATEFARKQCFLVVGGLYVSLLLDFHSWEFIFCIHVNTCTSVCYYLLIPIITTPSKDAVPQEFWVMTMYNKHWKTPYTGILRSVSTGKMKFYSYCQTSRYGIWRAWSARSHGRYRWLENSRNVRSEQKNRPHVSTVQRLVELTWSVLHLSRTVLPIRCPYGENRLSWFLLSVAEEHIPIEQ